MPGISSSQFFHVSFLILYKWSVSWLNPAGSAAFGLSVPATTMALRFFDPITAPRPLAPEAPSSASMVANATRFSAAGPMVSTLVSFPNSAFRLSAASKADSPHSAEASLITAAPSRIMR
ncbi:MAG: hypothetical protein ABR958_05890 [Dehalococcoidales bacterium]